MRILWFYVMSAFIFISQITEIRTQCIAYRRASCIYDSLYIVCVCVCVWGGGRLECTCARVIPTSGRGDYIFMRYCKWLGCISLCFATQTDKNIPNHHAMPVTKTVVTSHRNSFRWNLHINDPHQCGTWSLLVAIDDEGVTARAVVMTTRESRE